MISSARNHMQSDSTVYANELGIAGILHRQSRDDLILQNILNLLSVMSSTGGSGALATNLRKSMKMGRE